MIKDDKNVVKCMVLINGKEETHLAKYEGRKDLPGMHGSYRSQSSGDCPPRCQD